MAAYVPGDEHWKGVERQIQLTGRQAHAFVARRENYIAFSWGKGRGRSLIHRKYLVLLP